MPQTFEQFLKDRQTIVATSSGLSNHYIDLWEHGCLLFSAFEWEAAADLFAGLSRCIPVDLYSTVCLLNASIIYARLGEFSRASQALEEAENVAELLPITLFLMGHFEYEVGNLEKSEDCFNIALEALNSFQVFNHLGLNYVLRDELIRENIAVLQSPAPGMVATIPGDVIFEAPPRINCSISASCRGTRQWSITSMTSTDALSSRSLPAISTEAQSVPRIPLPDSESEKHRETVQPQILGPRSVLASRSTAPVIHKVLASPLPSRKDGFMTRYTRFRAAGKNAIAQRRSTKKAPEKKPFDDVKDRTPANRTQRMEARDARPGGNTTADLSTFLRSLPEQKRMVARDPRGRPGSSVGLAEFFRDTGPEDTQAAMAMISQISLESESVSEPETFVSAGLRGTSLRTALSSMASNSIHQVESSQSKDRTPSQRRTNSLEPPKTGPLMDSTSERPRTIRSGSSWQSQDRSCMKPPSLPQSLQPRAIHPAMRPDFSLD